MMFQINILKLIKLDSTVFVDYRTILLKFSQYPNLLCAKPNPTKVARILKGKNLWLSIVDSHGSIIGRHARC